MRIRRTPLTEALGLADLEGEVYGESIPSYSGVGPVLGDAGEDVALNVRLTHRAEGYWLVSGLVDFLAVSPGGRSGPWGRTADGGWEL